MPSNKVNAMTSLLEHPRGAEPGKPGDRKEFSFTTKTRLSNTAEGKGRDGARYGRTGVIHTPSWGYPDPSICTCCNASCNEGSVARKH